MRGGAELVFARLGDRTVLRSARSEPPLQIQRPICGPGGEAIVTLLTPTGDLLEGDAIDLQVVCEAGAEVVLRQASATRLHTCQSGDIGSSARFEVAAGARLWYLPCELIPFAKTRYCQDLRLDMAEGAQAVLREVVCPGRVWEREAARHLSLQVRVTLGDRLILVDSMRLQRPDSTATAHRSHVASILLLGAHYAQQDADRIHDAFGHEGLIGSASLLPCYGVGGRVLANSADAIYRACRLACPELRRFEWT